MYLLNLSLFQFLAVFGAISAMAVALYLLDRSRRRLIVSTLRFWVASEQPSVATRRRHIQQPWSLALQLISMALLLLAIAQLRLGAPARAGRDHVVILDTSAWMAARSGNRTLMDMARERARRYVRALPSSDRVMLVRADGMATPATALEPDHRKVEAAIQASTPGFTALNLDQALSFARRIQSQGGRRTGEITFIGTANTAEREPGTPPPPSNLRVILLPAAVENCGLRKIGSRRSSENAEDWEVFVSVRNYGSEPRTVTVALDFGIPGPAAGRTSAGARRMTLAPGAEVEASFDFRARTSGILNVTLSPSDAFPADNHAELELPKQPVLAVTVYSDQPDLLRPMLSATSRVNAVYRRPEQYRTDDAGLVILDRFIPAQRPKSDSIWIDPPVQGSPIPIRQTVERKPLVRWDPSNPVAAGLRTRDFQVERASVFEAAPTDGRVGEVDAGPIIVARPGRPRIVALGFHPAQGALRYHLATPLLFANLLRWASPEVFRRWEISGGSVGSVKLMLDQDTAARDVKVTAADGTPLPFVLHGRALSFFSGIPGSARVVAGDREYVHSLSLPQLGDTRWQPPAEVRHGLPKAGPILEQTGELWPWLAVAGGMGLVLEWLLFGRFRRPQKQGSPLILRSKLRARAEARQ